MSNNALRIYNIIAVSIDGDKQLLRISSVTNVKNDQYIVLINLKNIWAVATPGLNVLQDQYFYSVIVNTS